MKRYGVILLVVLISGSSVLNAAPREKKQIQKLQFRLSRLPIPYSDDNEISNNNVERPPQLNERERKHLIFTGLIDICRNIIEAIINRKDRPARTENIINVLGGVSHLAHTLTRRTMTPEMQEKLVVYILEQLQKYSVEDFARA